MIKTFRHKGLKRYFETGSTAGIQVKHQKRLRLQLQVLNAMSNVSELDLPGFYLHPLKPGSGWSIRVSGNWRLTFEFIDGDVLKLDYEDYH